MTMVSVEGFNTQPPALQGLCFRERSGNNGILLRVVCNLQRIARTLQASANNLHGASSYEGQCDSRLPFTPFYIR